MIFILLLFLFFDHVSAKCQAVLASRCLQISQFCSKSAGTNTEKLCACTGTLIDCLSESGCSTKDAFTECTAFQCKNAQCTQQPPAPPAPPTDSNECDQFALQLCSDNLEACFKDSSKALCDCYSFAHVCYASSSCAIAVEALDAQCLQSCTASECETIDAPTASPPASVAPTSSCTDTAKDLCTDAAASCFDTAGSDQSKLCQCFADYYACFDASFCPIEATDACLAVGCSERQCYRLSPAPTEGPPPGAPTIAPPTVSPPTAGPGAPTAGCPDYAVHECVAQFDTNLAKENDPCDAFLAMGSCLLHYGTASCEEKFDGLVQNCFDATKNNCNCKSLWSSNKAE